ncbi:MAG: hypothetical protein CL539_18610 [Alcanivorax sp.]|mgnify:FL=1|uniref:hypothetical protein n=1 Tax=Alcanivorax sp. TaxID=1872427 RepID=UPI000C8F4311|nr:hypothetical protein [Alcanivorax sp.]MAC16661.1 hypothetical protein [Alcanivorax sp.]|tara:strand:+ start:6933 stop:7172 length:240 start_codon:yes stop_codon:yes gene_type:complete
MTANTDLSNATDSLARFLSSSLERNKDVYDKSVDSREPYDKEQLRLLAETHALGAWIIWLQEQHPDEAEKLREAMEVWT